MHRRSDGFTLVEMVVAVAVIGILIALAMPSFSAWIQNTQIRTGTEAVLNGLQTARAEAVRRNQTVEFQLDAGTTGWNIVVLTTGEVVQTRAAGEGSTNAVSAVQPGGATTVSFNGMGWTVANNDGSATISQVDVTSSAMAGPEVRPLRVVVTPGGAARMCDPQVAAGDPRAC